VIRENQPGQPVHFGRSFRQSFSRRLNCHTEKMRPKIAPISDKTPQAVPLTAIFSGPVHAWAFFFRDDFSRISETSKKLTQVKLVMPKAG
jgi:hypothetical protein